MKVEEVKSSTRKGRRIQRHCLKTKPDARSRENADRITCLKGNVPYTTVNPRKIKLQLFPVDDRTRIGLEKDGYHPYLELTLSFSKRIYSVLKHINTKWSGSCIVDGEPVLYPFSFCRNPSNCIWTLSDTATNAGDVYATIGRPSVFRLRYGWMNENNSLKTLEVPAENNPIPGSLEVLHSFVDRQLGEVCLNKTHPATNTDFTDFENKLSCQLPCESQDVKNSTSFNDGAPSAVWDYNSTNFSVGDLLSECSLQGLQNCCSKLNVITNELDRSQLNSESCDALITTHLNSALYPQSYSIGSSSLLNAEDTCHPFSFEKGSCGQSAVGNDSSTQCRVLLDRKDKDPNADISVCAGVYNEENSLGLSALKWSDSLGSFGFDLTSWKTITEDSLSLGKIISAG